MNRKTWMTLLLGLAAMAVLAQYGRTQGCTPGYSAGSASIGDIMTACVEQYPAPQSRTDVGIGEQVTCFIDPVSWSGTAIYTDSYCNQSYVNDPLGTIAWSVSGQASVYPTTGDTATLTLDLADADNTVTVIGTAVDSLGVDPPVVKQKALNAKVPKSIQILSATDNPGTLGWQAGNANLGAADAFLFQVLPNTVNFNKVSFGVHFSGVNLV